MPDSVAACTVTCYTPLAGLQTVRAWAAVRPRHTADIGGGMGPGGGVAAFYPPAEGYPQYGMAMSTPMHNPHAGPRPGSTGGGSGGGGSGGGGSGGGGAGGGGGSSGGSGSM